ncbi:MAG: DUF5686 family protein [Psychroflexus halocasei]
MKSLFFVFCFIFASLLVHGQIRSKDTLKLIDAESKKPIANAILITKHHQVYQSNLDGDLLFGKKFKDSLTIKAAFYQDVNFLYQKQDTIFLKPSSSPKILGNKEKNKLDSLILKASMLKFKSRVVERTKIDPQNDSLIFDLRKSSEYKKYKGSTDQVIIDQIDINGFDQIDYNVIRQNIVSYNLFQNKINFLKDKIYSALGSTRYRAYQFYTLHQDERQTILFYKSRQSRYAWQGLIFINNKTDAIENYTMSFDAEYQLYFMSTFESFNQFPLSQELYIRPGYGGEKLSFFGGTIKLGEIQQSSFTDQPQAYLSHLRVYDDISDLDETTDNTIVQTKFYSGKPKEINLWQNIAYEFMTEAPKSGEYVSDYVSNNNLSSRLRRRNAFKRGFFPINFADVDLKRLVKLNNYEGFRFGLGFQTNSRFSDRFRLGTYVAYGTKDASFKHGFSGGALLNKETNTWLNVDYAQDINEVGTNKYMTDQRAYSLFEPRLVNITYFYKYKTVGLDIQHNFSPKIMTELRFERSEIEQTRPYQFESSDGILKDYKLSTAKFGLRWTPNSTHLSIDDRVFLQSENSPTISAQVEQSFSDVFNSDLSFTKVSAKFDYIYQHINNHTSELNLEGNIGFGDLPITHAFHALPNSPNKEKIVNRFSVAGVKSFETMYFNEFFSSRQATLHFKHYFPSYRINRFMQPQLVLISRHAVGDFLDKFKHQEIEFNTIDKVYNEAAVEVNNILFGFGLSLAYRYGAYHLPTFEDNVSFKFTFYLKL